MGKKPLRKRFKALRHLFLGFIAQMFSVGILLALNPNVQEIKSVKDYYLNIEFKNHTLVQVFGMIESQTGYHFAYDKQKIEWRTTFSRNYPSQTCLSDILMDISKHAGVSFKQINKNIIVQKIERDKPDIERLQIIIQTRNVSGKVISGEDSEALPGVNVIEKGTSNGTITDIEGNYVLQVSEGATLVFSSVGYLPQEIELGARSVIDVTMETDIRQLEEIVVVGYGEQRKESIVGAITNVTNEVLERRGGVPNLGSALSGQIPGVMVMERTGEPGREDPQILIRGQSTWNDASPLILVDGVERRMNDINVHEVESVSVLKDASATAVFGVKGANGVILITTKRGQTGKPKLTMSANMGIKNVSKIFTVTEAVTSQLWKNAAIEHEVAAYETSWPYYVPYSEVMKSKRPQQYPDIYPNVDWPEVMLKPFATNEQVNLNVSGGTEFTKYFASMAYTHEGDLMRSKRNEKGYDPVYSYDRMNFRGNLDFQLTNTTMLSTNISGYAGMKKETLANGFNWIFNSLYTLQPDAFPVKYSDGVYGKDPDNINNHNPVAILNETGVERINRLFIGTDFKLEQKLDFITKGLSANATLSFDNYFGSTGPNITDVGNQGQTLYKYVSPAILEAETRQDTINATIWIPSVGSSTINEYDFFLRPWTISSESVNNGSTQRTLFYQLALNYARNFDRHSVSGLVLMNRRQTASGAVFPAYREDWVGRAVYSYNDTYFAEVNAAYNGSEKFGPGYRFGFFPSLAAGWMLSNESFLQNYDWLDKLKIRGSIGKVGSDTGIPRWAYIESWRSGQYAFFGNLDGVTNPNSRMQSPYDFYWEDVIPNPDLSWETAIKKDIGLELGFFQNMISIEADYFQDNRKDIFLGASTRNIPDYFGAKPVPINYGKTETRGIEIDLSFRKTTQSGFNYWIKQSMTRAKDKVLVAEDPALQDDYLKTAGYQISQTKSQIRDGSISTNWDEVYAQTAQDVNIRNLPGDWGIIDFNGDGKINSFDNIPYAFPSNRPGNTYSTFLGFGYKGFSCMIQFYGVTNITQSISLVSPGMARATALHSYLVDYWTKYNPDAAFKAPRLGTGSPMGEFAQFDGSYLRLKTAEIAYQLPERFISRLGLSLMKVYVNGNNLLFWSDLPMDRESGSFDQYNSYPTYRVFNLGMNVGF